MKEESIERGINMTKEQLIDYYRNQYQITLASEEELKKELEEFITLTTIYKDIIESLHKRLAEEEKYKTILNNLIEESLNKKESKNV